MSNDSTVAVSDGTLTAGSIVTGALTIGTTGGAAAPQASAPAVLAVSAAMAPAIVAAPTTVSDAGNAVSPTVDVPTVNRQPQERSLRNAVSAALMPSAAAWHGKDVAKAVPPPSSETLDAVARQVAAWHAMKQRTPSARHLRDAVFAGFDVTAD